MEHVFITIEYLVHSGSFCWQDEEANLASLKGLNHFSASIVLCQVSLEEFIDLLPEERVSAFGAYILPDHIVSHLFLRSQKRVAD